ncbi:hypothetical protein TROPICALSUN_96 [Erwinia phage vB_EamM_TropicalSun]|uniref:Uncharacterized protein n=2 Tax=Myosmarvirus myosmar TaxID=2846183 RepID=A0A5B9NLW1_9CAUD|nr:hypothetical protein HWC56_gp102 [Serratia phage MyoSmar]QEG09551.1 hypothetical protein CPT_MyoSmar_102 [Serratia phage MyoSmar]QEG13885.1 hypothetical protein TROPICALSUN_96 [Erwinia phage vB_EamM_TropicalSun]
MTRAQRLKREARWQAWLLRDKEKRLRDADKRRREMNRRAKSDQNF